MKVAFDWAMPNQNRMTHRMDWDAVPPWASKKIVQLLGTEDGDWPEVGVRHILRDWGVGITFSDPTPEEVVGQPPLTPYQQEKVNSLADSLRNRYGMAPDSIVSSGSVPSDLERAILLVKSNGYNVTKQPQPGMDYVNDLLEWAGGLPNRLVTTDHEQAKLSQLVNAVGLDAEHHDIEIYVEIDRSLLISQFEYAIASGEYGPHSGADELWTHLWPVVIRVDEQGDIVLHATSAERAQFGGTDDVSRFDQPGML